VSWMLAVLDFGATRYAHLRLVSGCGEEPVAFWDYRFVAWDIGEGE
jgi:hypothetical protein